jgi:Fe-S-cluster containining protein
MCHPFDMKNRITELLAACRLTGLVRYLNYKWFGRDIILTGQCRRCGACCRNLVLDIHGEWVRSEEDFFALKEENPDYARFRITGRGKDGLLRFTCDRLTEDGCCRDHENRLPICRNYPERDMFFMNGDLLPGCGYELHQDVPFERVLCRKMKQAGKRGKEKGAGS